MFPRGSSAISGATQLGPESLAREIKPDDPLIDKHIDGAVAAVREFANRNSSQPIIFVEGSWVRNHDGTYSKTYRLILNNGAETGITSTTKISEREYFKRKLKDG